MSNCYFRVSDPQVRQMDDFTIPSDWWSRPWEYAWVAQFVKVGEVVLDAGCGIEHPLKFYLGRRAIAFACDIDPLILSVNVPADCCLFIHQMDITKLTYSSFSMVSMDAVYCISVLEHLSQDDRRAALQSFRRILKPGGRLILTVDVPTADPEKLIGDLQQAGFQVGDYDLTVPEDAVTGWGLMVYRIIAVKG